MQLRYKYVIVAMVLLLILIISCVYIIGSIMTTEDESKLYIDRTDLQQIIKDNFVPGKEEALNNAKRYLEYAEYGSAFSANAVKGELEALGYSKEEIEYALSKIPEEEYINGIIKMYNAYDKKPTLEQAIEMWTDIGFTEKQIRKAFEKI